MSFCLITSIRNGIRQRFTFCSCYCTNTNYVKQAQSGKAGFEEDFKKTHLETSRLQKLLLGVGSGLISISNPSRGDMIAVMGETTGLSSLEYMKSQMLESEEGRRILEDKPRINSATVDLDKLKVMQDGTLGQAYSNFLEKYKYTPDTRLAVRFVDDLELAYIIQRYREVHDLFHAMFNMPTNMLGEVTVKWVEAIQTRLPMCIGAAVFGSVRLSPKFTRAYSTISKAEKPRKPQISLDESFISNINKRALKFRHHPGNMKISCVQLPAHIEKAIKRIVKVSDKDKVMIRAKQLQGILESRKRPAEALELKQLKKRVTDKVLEEFAMPDMETSSESEIDIEMKKRDYLIKKLYINYKPQWQSIEFSRNTGVAYMALQSVPEYATLLKIMTEISIRDPEFSPRYLFDFGSGIGTVSWAAHTLWHQSIREYFCVDISQDMHNLAMLVLTDSENEKQFIKGDLHQRLFFPTSSTGYDLVVSSHTLLELPDAAARFQTLVNLWNKVSQYLIIVEPAHTAGFQTILEIRDFLLQNAQDCHVFAPCPHDFACPKQALSSCYFNVKYMKLALGNQIPEPLVQKFVYVVLKRGPRPPEDPQWPRFIENVHHKHKHTVCTLCTSCGQMPQVVMTERYHGKEAYKCSKHCDNGDLLPGQITLPEETGLSAQESASNENE